MNRALILAGALALASCTTAQKQQASDTARASIDAICANLSVADQAARLSLTAANANGTAFRVETDAVAAISGYCSARPLANPGQALVAISAAFARVVAAEAVARGQ